MESGNVTFRRFQKNDSNEASIGHCNERSINGPVQARAQTFWGAGAQTPKKGHSSPQKILTELKHKQHYTNYAVLDLRFLLAGLDS